MAEIPIVDELDNVLYYKERNEITLEEIYRVSACWIMNPQGDILLAQRAFTKKTNPGKWGPAVAGTVTGKETYLENILQEIQEEIGICIVESDLEVGPHELREGIRTYYRQWYFLILDLTISAFTIQVEEVEALMRISQKELNEKIGNTPGMFSSSILKRKSLFEEYIEEKLRVDTIFEKPVAIDDVLTELEK